MLDQNLTGQSGNRIRIISIMLINHISIFIVNLTAYSTFRPLAT